MDDSGFSADLEENGHLVAYMEVLFVLEFTCTFVLFIKCTC